MQLWLGMKLCAVWLLGHVIRGFCFPFLSFASYGNRCLLDSCGLWGEKLCFLLLGGYTVLSFLFREFWVLFSFSFLSPISFIEVWLINKIVRYLKYTTWLFNIYICAVKIHTKLMNTSVNSQIYLFFFLVRTFMFYS